MIAQQNRVAPVQRAQPPRYDALVCMPRKSGSRRTDFDAHRWLERYLASHDGADPSDPLAGVPFN